MCTLLRSLAFLSLNKVHLGSLEGHSPAHIHNPPPLTLAVFLGEPPLRDMQHLSNGPKSILNDPENWQKQLKEPQHNNFITKSIAPRLRDQVSHHMLAE